VVPKIDAKDKGPLRFWPLFWFSCSIPFILGLDDFAGYVPLFSLGKSDLGSLESSNIAGGLVASVSEQAYDIQSEIDKNEMKIGPSSPCFSQALRFNELLAAQSNVQLIERIRACDPNGATGSCSAKEYFNANYKTILSAYLQIARCRLADESSKKFISFMMDPGSPSKSYPTLLKDLYMQKCFYSNRGNPAGMRNCYLQQYKIWIDQRARAAFPNVVRGCQ
jgi:hypothetical protein